MTQLSLVSQKAEALNSESLVANCAQL